jgi:6,7-dimethyl-8-ribityllumazine synthase
MSTNFRAATTHDGGQELNGGGLRIAVVCGRFNDLITTRLLDGALAELGLRGVAESDVTVAWVPGAFEIPMAAKAFAERRRVDAVITLGAVIRGETSHYDFVAGECASGVQQVQLATGIPVVFGVLTTEDLDQAMARSEPDPQGHNVGRECVRTAIEMAALLARIGR